MGGHATYLPYRGFERPAIKRVYFNGGASSDQLEVGYLLCYKHDATVRTSPTDPNNTFGVTVTKPAAANLALPAGIVVNRKKGAGWVDIFDISDAGKFVIAMLKVNATALTSTLKAIDGQYEVGAHSDATINIEMFGLACETHNSSVTPALKLIKLIGQ